MQDMLVNAEYVKSLREDKSWSQDQLAQMCDVSLRTVQRVEATGNCALETKRALAAAFDLDAHDLDVPQAVVERAAKNNSIRLSILGAVFGLALGLLGIGLDFLTVDGSTSLSLSLKLGLLGGLCGLLAGVYGVLNKPTN